MAATGYGRRVRVDIQKWVIGIGSLTPPGTTCLAALCFISSPGTGLDDGSQNATPGTTEPTIGTNGYSRKTVTWNTTVATPSNDAAAVNQNDSSALSWTSSGGAFSTAANALNYVFLYLTAATSSTTEANYIGRASITVPQAVNAAGITLTIATGGLTMNLISA